MLSRLHFLIRLSPAGSTGLNHSSMFFVLLTAAALAAAAILFRMIRLVELA